MSAVSARLVAGGIPSGSFPRVSRVTLHPPVGGPARHRAPGQVHRLHSGDPLRVPPPSGLRQGGPASRAGSPPFVDPIASSAMRDPPAQHRALGRSHVMSSMHVHPGSSPFRCAGTLASALFFLFSFVLPFRLSAHSPASRSLRGDRGPRTSLPGLPVLRVVGTSLGSISSVLT